MIPLLGNLLIWKQDTRGLPKLSPIGLVTKGGLIVDDYDDYYGMICKIIPIVKLIFQLENMCSNFTR